uniref:Transcription factor bHLH25-like isoform X1 n=1 Tax=Cymbidium sinense TaxID=112615 RepID=A0A513X540_9ASPA|nr:transcription factor bHLH25-like isoform X1 [Cymbidium sinense]
MEPKALHWISEPGLDESAAFIMQHELLTLTHYSPQELISNANDNELQKSITSTESFTLFPSGYSVEKSMEVSQGIYKADQHGLFLVPEAPFLLSFNQSQAENLIYDQADVPKDRIKRNGGVVNGETERKKMRMGLGQTTYSLDHILAERKRREKLSQRFIALAAIIPGLKKMDKASVLGDAVKHIKELEERVKSLEEDKIEMKTVEFSTMNMKPSHDYSNDCESPISSVENNNIIGNNSSDQKLHPHEIKIKICGKAVLVKIHCENHKGVLAKLVSDFEELHLMISNFSAVPFMESSFLDITVAAQIEEGCFITAEGIAKKLNSALSQFN